jgi:N-acetylglutamate synthase-like GNAT family acetyltransferase
MLRAANAGDFDAILGVINDAAEAYRGFIPADCWHVPYMSGEELRHELAAGVRFSVFERSGSIVGVMGVQDVRDVTLIRHAYVRTKFQNSGIGAELLGHLTARASRPVLIGTWAAARWAIRFYEKRGFRVVPPDVKERLLRTYWTVPDRQIATSVVLVDRKWLERNPIKEMAGEDATEGER